VLNNNLRSLKISRMKLKIMSKYLSFAVNDSDV
jgi:hypothetical protein